MKKLRLLPILMATISFLASCGSPKIKEYTVTINSDPARHCTPSKSTLKFKENVFDPITVPYTIDPNFVITRTEVDVEENECDFDNDKKELMIIPKKNANFSITITTHNISSVAYITLENKSPEHIEPRRTRAPFVKHGEYYPVSFSYIIDKYCSLVAKVSSGEATYNIDSAKNKLIVTPTGDSDITINISAKEEYKIVSFNVLGGKFGPLASPSIKMPYGKTWGECVDETKQIASKDEMDFKGWSFDSSGYGEPILDTTKIDENTPNTVYAIYHHRISLNSKSLKIRNLDYDETYLSINVRLKDMGHYELPNENDITINVSGKPVDFEYETTTQIDASFKIKIDDLTSKTIRITVTDNQPIYNVTFDVKTGLESKADSLEVKRGEAYQFKLSTVNQNEEFYYISDHLTITVTDKTGHQTVLDDDAYKVKVKDETRQEADVMIRNAYVKGDLHIEAVPLQTDAYYYDFWGHGIKMSQDGQTWYANRYGYQKSSNELKFYLEEVEGLDRLTNNHILVIINDKDYYLLSNLPEEYGDIITLSQDKAFIVVNPHTIKEIYSLRINIYHPNYEDTFEMADNWKIISTLSSGPQEVVSELFPVSKERYVTLSNSNISYKVRVIDVYHDPLASDPNKKAGLTIEFENVIADSSGDVLTTSYDKDYNTNFPGSILNTLLNSILSNFPSELQSIIKAVNKPVAVGNKYEVSSYLTKLFSLSCHEMNKDHIEDTKDEGETYKYYMEDSQSRRIKTTAFSASTPCAYWTRSPDTYPGVGAYVRSIIVDDDGDIENRDVSYRFGFAPAFCI